MGEAVSGAVEADCEVAVVVGVVGGLRAGRCFGTFFLVPWANFKCECGAGEVGEALGEIAGVKAVRGEGLFVASRV